MSNEQALSPSTARDMLAESADNAGAFDPREAVVSIDDALRICEAARPSPARDKVLEEAALVAEGEPRSWDADAPDPQTRIAAAIRALKAQPPSTVIPEGMVLVSMARLLRLQDRLDSEGFMRISRSGAAHEIDAMIAAAPKPTQSSTGMDEREKLIEEIAVGVSDKVIIRLDVHEDDPRLSLIIDELRADLVAALSAIPASVGEDR